MSWAIPFTDDRLVRDEILDNDLQGVAGRVNQGTSSSNTFLVHSDRDDRTFRRPVALDRPAELVCQNTAHHSRAIALGSLRRTDGGPSALGPHHRDDDVIAPNRKMTASVIANLKQVVKEGSLRLHPLVTRLVDPETLQKTREPGSDRIRDVRF